MSGYKMPSSQVNRLVGVAYYDLARDFIHIQANLYMDVKRIRELHPNLFNTVKKDLERGYRTTNNELTIRVEDTLLDWLYASWRMSYIGKGSMQLFLVDQTNLSNLRSAIKGLTELMENPCTTKWNDGGLKVTAPVTFKDIYDKRRNRERSVPQVTHSFREIRPLVLKELEKERDYRMEALKKWITEPTLQLNWSK